MQKLVMLAVAWAVATGLARAQATQHVHNPFQKDKARSEQVAHDDSVRRGYLYEPPRTGYLLQATEHERDRELRLTLFSHASKPDELRVYLGQTILRRQLTLADWKNNEAALSWPFPAGLVPGSTTLLVELRRSGKHQAFYTLYGRSYDLVGIWYDFFAPLAPAGKP